jgi:hypothetical protein
MAACRRLPVRLPWSIAQASLGRGHDFHAVRVGGWKNQGAVAKNHARLGQGLAGGGGVKRLMFMRMHL